MVTGNTHNRIDGATACITNRHASVTFHGVDGLHMLEYSCVSVCVCVCVYLNSGLFFNKHYIPSHHMNKLLTSAKQLRDPNRNTISRNNSTTLLRKPIKSSCLSGTVVYK